MKRKVGWTMKAISAIFGAIGAFVRWLIEAVFKLM